MSLFAVCYFPCSFNPWDLEQISRVVHYVTTQFNLHLLESLVSIMPGHYFTQGTYSIMHLITVAT